MGDRPPDVSCGVTIKLRCDTRWRRAAAGHICSVMWTVTEVVDGEERSDRFPTASKALDFALRSEALSGVVIFNPDGLPDMIEGVGRHGLEGRAP